MASAHIVIVSSRGGTPSSSTKRKGATVGKHEVPSLARRSQTAVTDAIGRAVPALDGADPVIRRSG